MSFLRGAYRDLVSAWIDFKWMRANRYRIQEGTQILNGLTYSADGLFLANSSDNLHDKRFAAAYQESLSVDDWRGTDGQVDMRWRYYMVCWFADFVKHLPGDFVECGVYKGGYAKAIMHYLPFAATGKTYHMLDTYEGLSEVHLTEQERESGLFERYEKNYESCLGEVLRTFANDPVSIIPGTVPETLAQCTAQQVCYLSIDMNCVAPEIAAANFFWDKLVPGAVVMLDDYGFPGHEEQKKAFDQFAADRDAPLLSLPTGQAVMFKR